MFDLIKFIDWIRCLNKTVVKKKYLGDLRNNPLVDCSLDLEEHQRVEIGQVNIFINLLELSILFIACIGYLDEYHYWFFKRSFSSNSSRTNSSVYHLESFEMIIEYFLEIVLENLLIPVRLNVWLCPLLMSIKIESIILLK